VPLFDPEEAFLDQRALISSSGLAEEHRSVLEISERGIGIPLIPLVGEDDSHKPGLLRGEAERPLQAEEQEWDRRDAMIRKHSAEPPYEGEACLAFLPALP
jgi:hypothetical protein